MFVLKVGAGMVIAILSDISIASDKAEFNDGHIRFFKYFQKKVIYIFFKDLE